MTGLPELPKGGSVTAPPKEQLSQKELLDSTKAYLPWHGRGYDNDRFESWYEWMRSDKSEFPLNKLTVHEAFYLYQVFSGVAWDCHYNHSLIKPKV